MSIMTCKMGCMTWVWNLKFFSSECGLQIRVLWLSVFLGIYCRLIDSLKNHNASKVSAKAFQSRWSTFAGWIFDRLGQVQIFSRSSATWMGICRMCCVVSKWKDSLHTLCTVGPAWSWLISP
jgi:hypothetical protein